MKKVPERVTFDQDREVSSSAWSMLTRVCLQAIQRQGEPSTTASAEFAGVELVQEGGALCPCSIALSRLQYTVTATVDQEACLAPTPL